MIINDKILVKINNKNIEHYSSKYTNIIYGDEIYVNSEDLKKYSKVKIRYECDICINIFITSFSCYYSSINKKSSIDYLQGKSLCKKCTSIKCKQTILIKYGCKSYTETDEYKKIIKDKYGVDNISQLQSVKDRKIERSIEKYGVEYGFQCDLIKEKIKKTCLDKYGVDNPIKNREIFERAQSTAFKKHKYNSNIIYQGSYELDFINIINGKLYFENGPSIPYIMDGKDRIYHSDFYLPKYNLVVEIKSQYTYDCDYKENIIKEKYTKKLGYNFIFIIDKDYTEFDKIIKDYDK